MPRKPRDVEKSVGKSAGRRPLAGAAADPRKRGRGPKKGAPNAGRPPDEFKAFMRALVSRAAVCEALASVVGDPRHPDFVKAFKMAAEFGYGRAAQPMEHAGPDGAAIPMALHITHEVVDPAAG